MNSKALRQVTPFPNLLKHHRLSSRPSTIDAAMITAKRFLITNFLLLSLVRLSSAAPTKISRTPKPVPLPTGFTYQGLQGLVPEIKRWAVVPALSNHLYLNKERKRQHIPRPFQLPVFVRQSGLTGDACTSSTQCAGERVCSTREALGSRRCVPVRGLKDCNNDSACDAGEMCVSIGRTDRSVCFSQGATKNIGTSSQSSDGGFTGDKCTSDTDCAGARVCIDFANDLRCVPNAGLTRCRDGDDCPSEGCQTVFEGGQKFCTSEGFATEIESEVTVEVTGPDSTTPTEAPTTQRPTTDSNTNTESSATTEKGPTDSPSSKPPSTTPPTESSSTEPSSSTTGSSNTPVAGNQPDENADGDAPSEDTTNEPCIGIHSLKHLSRDRLVFEKDRLARVLCDVNESCATPGHMVRYRGRAMMMKSYCEIDGGCVERVMFVNSPRYSRGVTVESGSEELVFTAFSARYVTRAEEGALSVAIIVGF